MHTSSSMLHGMSVVNSALESLSLTILKQLHLHGYEYSHDSGEVKLASRQIAPHLSLIGRYVRER